MQVERVADQLIVVRFESIDVLVRSSDVATAGLAFPPDRSGIALGRISTRCCLSSVDAGEERSVMNLQGFVGE